MELLRDPKLLDRILSDFERCGVVGEETNKKVAYLAAVSRLLPAPLAVVLQSSSAAGKSSLMEAVLDFLPEEQRVRVLGHDRPGAVLHGRDRPEAQSAGRGGRRRRTAGRVCAEAVAERKGCSPSPRTGKDPNTGRLITHQYRVEGPVMIFLTTTAIDVDEELLNRCMVLAVNEDRSRPGRSTPAAGRRRRSTACGRGRMLTRSASCTTTRSGCWKPLAVVNQHVGDLTFPDGAARPGATT